MRMLQRVRRTRPVFSGLSTLCLLLVHNRVARGWHGTTVRDAPTHRVFYMITCVYMRYMAVSIIRGLTARPTFAQRSERSSTRLTGTRTVRNPGEGVASPH